MISPARITELLSRQETLSPEDKRQLEQIVVRYPYFVPAQLILAVQRPNAAPALQSCFINQVMIARHLPPVKLRQPQPVATPASQVENPETVSEGDVLTIPENENVIKTEETIVTAQPLVEKSVAQTENSLTEQDQPLEKETSITAIPEMEEQNNTFREEEIMVVPAEKNTAEAEIAADASQSEALEESIEEPEAAPVFVEDYFRYEGIEVPAELPEKLNENLSESKETEPIKQEEDKAKSLMVMMSFTDWLLHYRQKSQAAKDEEEDRMRVKSAWQREKLAAALQEEEEEIPEQVFEMAVNSLAQEDSLVSESLATILAKQGKTKKAIEMLHKLSLKYPQKSAYFASQIQNLKREENP